MEYCSVSGVMGRGIEEKGRGVGGLGVLAMGNRRLWGLGFSIPQIVLGILITCLFLKLKRGGDGVLWSLVLCGGLQTAELSSGVTEEMGPAFGTVPM